MDIKVQPSDCSCSTTEEKVSTEKVQDVAYSLKASSILKKNVDYMLHIIDVLPKFDTVANRVLRACNVHNDLEVNYDVEMSDTVGKLEGKTIKINPQYLLNHDSTLSNTSLLEFVLAHEVGHYKFPYRAPSYVLLMAYAAFGYQMDFKTIPVVASTIATIAGIVWLKRREESWCDNYAAKKVGTRGAIEFFHLLMMVRKKTSWLSYIWNYDLVHPAPATRLKAMHKMADSVLAAKNAKF